MSQNFDHYTLRLADGRIVVGPVHGSGGTIPAGQHARLQRQIDRANEGEPLGIYEPAPGCASMHTPDGRMTIDLRGATLIIGEAWTCHARPAALGRTCGHVNTDGGRAIGAAGSARVHCAACGCTKKASDDRAPKQEDLPWR